MYIREKKTRTTPALQLVSGRRDHNGKVRQEIILSLGNVPIPDELRKTIAHEVENRMNGYQRLLPLQLDAAKWVDFILKKLDSAGKLTPINHQEQKVMPETIIDGVLLDRLKHENTTLLGPLLPLEAAWKSLGMSEFLDGHKFSPQQISAAKISIYNRLIEPISENSLLSWAETTALNELFGEHIELSGEDRFYRVSDKLLACQPLLEIHLRERERELFNLNRTIVLYDLTNSYFEGEASANSKACRSANSKEKRTDRPVVSVGLVLDGEGFVLTHKVFPGNLHDSRSLVEAVKNLQGLCGNDRKPMVVLDGGIATTENLACLLENGFDYVVNGKRTTRQKFAADFLEVEKFRQIGGRDDKTPVLVRRLDSEQEATVLCRSDERKKKEDAIISKTEEKLLAAFEKLKKRIDKNDGKLHLEKGAETVNRNIGKLCGKYIRAAKFYDIAYEAESRQLSWIRNDEKYQADAELHGCYHLRSSRKDLSDDNIWHIYITLTKVENAFRLLKSDLGLRPFFHYTEDRCDGHIWITILAYHLLRWIEYSLETVGCKLSWQKIRRLLATHCYTTMIIPTTDGKVRHMRKPGLPDERQRAIYHHLAIDCAKLPSKATIFKKM
ncbi:MAG: IS1634 family transposase [Lentisphaerae bacterium]|nr:IS1634 family transposase [Victivallaceae bacterium]NLK83656.1 IS1634 family transposase [Lentisphaerota bacterium]